MYEPCYQYVFTGHMPEWWKIEHGIAASWGSGCGGVRQLRVVDVFGKAQTIDDLIDEGVLKGMEVPVGL